MSELILAIEDEEPVREAIIAALESSGYRVITAEDGQEGLERLVSERPDLVLLDLMLPKIHGMDVCAAIREHSEVPVIMLTGLAAEDDRVEGLTRGADDYITKPSGRASWRRGCARCCAAAATGRAMTARRWWSATWRSGRRRARCTCTTSASA